MWWIIDTQDKVAQQATEDAICDGRRWIKVYTDDWRAALTEAINDQKRDELEHAKNWNA